jgi:uncharacterized protein YwqG
MLTRERIRELIEEYGLSDRADEIMAEVRPSIHLTLRYDVDETDIPIGASKLGGLPDVPEGFEFPTWHGQYLSFVAQIRLSDAKPFDLENLLPETGMLYFFFEVSQYLLVHQADHDPNAPYKIVYVADENTPLTRRQHPTSRYYYDRKLTLETWVYKACPIVFEQEWTPCSPEHVNSKQRTLPTPSSAEFEQYLDYDGWWEAVQDELVTPMHRLLGIETEIQGWYEMMREARDAWNYGAAEDWMLLLQLDSDEKPENHEKPGFLWGDVGLIYFCIHKDDLHARHFDRVWLTFDHH